MTHNSFEYNFNKIQLFKINVSLNCYKIIFHLLFYYLQFCIKMNIKCKFEVYYKCKEKYPLNDFYEPKTSILIF